MSLILLKTSSNKCNAILNSEGVIRQYPLDSERSSQFFAGEIYMPSINSLQVEFIEDQGVFASLTY